VNSAAHPAEELEKRRQPLLAVIHECSTHPWYQ
jgi:hypothetical protein